METLVWNNDMWESALINSVLTGAQLLGQCFQEERRMKRRTISAAVIWLKILQ